MNLTKMESTAGRFFFRHRNWWFPVVTVALFTFARPPTTLLGSELLEHIKDWLAILICAVGLAIRGMVIGFAYIKRGGLNKQVYADTLQTAGIFQLCRNPLYCGNMLIWPSVFLMHGDPLILTLGTLSFLEMYRCIIKAEEEFLSAKFGADYQRYCADVPRWIPKIERFRQATADLSFDWRRVVMNDYITVATSVISLALVEVYEYWNGGGDADYLVFLRNLIVVTLLAVGVLRWVKKRYYLNPAS